MPVAVDDGVLVDQERLVYLNPEEVDRSQQFWSKDLDHQVDAVVRLLIHLDLDMVELMLK